jgi:hypothetical protein
LNNRLIFAAAGLQMTVEHELVGEALQGRAAEAQDSDEAIDIRAAMSTRRAHRVAM